MRYIDVATSLDGKKYRESTNYGYDFLSRHKQSCRKKKKDDYGEYYETESYDKKEGGIVYSICRNCGFREINNAGHFDENLIYQK